MPSLPKLLVAGLMLGWTTLAQAQDLRVGMQSEPTSVDPHFYNFGPNNGFSRHLFDALLFFDKDDNLRPGLAESWKAVDDKTWEFKLRQHVTWHDGSPFTADDVVFTFERAKTVPRSPNSFATFIGARVVEKVDDQTVRFRSPGPDPLILNNMPNVMIVSAKHGRSATTDDYNTGKAAIGTGPFKFAEFIPGDRVTVTRNDTYWGPKSEWPRVIFKAIRNDTARMAALLAGDVDVVENIPTADMARLRADPTISVSSAVSTRMMYLHLDRHRDVSPHITAKDGKPIPNPLHDLKVRQALSTAINRQAIVDRLMEKEAVVAAQFLTDRYPGASTKLKPQAYDPNRARELLAAAGYPNGFKMTLHGPNGRYPNDAKVLEAMAQMFVRVGIEVQVEAMAPAIFFSRASNGGPGGVPEFSLIFAGGGSSTAEPSSALIALLLTNDRARGLGAANRGRYSNSKVDQLTLDALAVMDGVKRNAMLAEATEIAFDDLGMIPLYIVNNTWAARKPISVEPRSDEFTLVMGIKPR
jgi:peptide/nickel transport system substrate-binding protein